ncbi:MAG: histidine kinase, partial [Bacteroidota bacterium]
FYKAIGQFDSALLHHEQYLNFQDSLFRNGQQEEIHRLEVVHQTEQMQREILEWQQKAEIEGLKVRQRNLGILLLLGLFAVLGGWLIFRNRHRLLREQFHRLQAEQRLLRSQTNPHFFFHALSGIQQFILQEKDLNQSIRYLSRFARLMRKVLEQSRTEEISLSEELETLEHYLQLQQLRYDQKFTYEITVDPIIDPDWCQIPPLLLQPIVENAIEHGLAPKDGPGHLQILIREQVNGLTFIVEDNGVGRGHKATSTPATRKSLATQIIQERLDLLRHQFGSAQVASLEVQDLTDAQQQPAGTLVTLRLPTLDSDQ